MRFLADENVESVTVRRLRSQEHDVSSVCESMATTTDVRLIDSAVAEGRVVFIDDTDLGDLVHRGQVPHVGVLLLRLTETDPADRLARPWRPWPLIEASCWQRFLVVKDDRVLLRPPTDP